MLTRRAVLADWTMRVLTIALLAILILLPFHAFISTFGGTALGPLLVWKSWKELLLLAIIPVVVLYCIARPDVAKRVWSSWLMRLIAIYVLLHIVFALVSQASIDAVLAGLLMNLRFLAIFVLAQLIIYSNHPWVARIKQWAPTWLLATGVVLSVLAILQVTVIPKDFLVQFGYGPETVMPYTVVDSQPDALRAFATMRGPNPLGAYLLIVLAASLVFVARQRRNVLASACLVLSAVALVFTSSRSAWLGAGAGLVILAFTLLPRQKIVTWAKWGAIPFVLACAVFVWLAVSVPAIRLAVFHSTTERASLTAGSSDKHWFEVFNGSIDAANNPLGQGVGTAGPASYYNQNNHPKIAENYFVQLAQEVGIFGLLLFIAINGVLAYQLWRQRTDPWAKVLLASFVGLTVINLFLHGWADDPTAMTWWGLAGLFLSAQKAKR